MDVSPKALREVEFRELRRGGGYHPEDVDHFIEEVAKGVEALQDRLRQAVERAQRAETAASEVTGNDETLRRTLVLAQRTADLAVQEAREQASRILSGAEAQAQTVIVEAEERARRTYEETVGSSRTELADLESVRQRAQVEVDGLQRWADEHRDHLVASLEEAIAAVERAGGGAPAPTSTPILSAGRPVTGNGQLHPPAVAVGPPTDAATSWGPADGMQPDPATVAPPSGPVTVAVADSRPGVPAGGIAAPDAVVHDVATGEVPVVDPPEDVIDIDIDAADGGLGDDDARALDNFFQGGEYGDDRRFGGRLRRRR